MKVPVLLEVKLIFILKEIIMMWNHHFQHLLVSLTHLTVSLKKYDPINSLEDRPYHTVIPGTLTAFSSYVGFH